MIAEGRNGRRRGFCSGLSAIPPRWRNSLGAMVLRRLVFALLCLALTGVQLWLAMRAMAPGGWTAWEGLTLLCFAGTAPWTALCAANALVGLIILLRAPHPPAAVLPALGRIRPGGGRMRSAIA